MKKKDTKWMVVLLVAVILLLGVACYLHLDCRNLEVLLAEGKGTEAETMQVLSRMTLEPSLSLESQLEERRTELAESEAERQRLEARSDASSPTTPVWAIRHHRYHRCPPRSWRPEPRRPLAM